MEPTEEDKEPLSDEQKENQRMQEMLETSHRRLSFFATFKRELSNVSLDISRGLDNMGRTLVNTVNENWSSPTLDNFKSSSLIQLVSRSSGKCLQVVRTDDDTMTVDGNGEEGTEAKNSQWLVTDLGRNNVLLQNGGYYLVINNGTTGVAPAHDAKTVGSHAQFRVLQKQHFVCLESVDEPGRHIGVQGNGQLKSAIATGTENDGQFGVRFLGRLVRKDSVASRKESGEVDEFVGGQDGSTDRGAKLDPAAENDAAVEALAADVAVIAIEKY